MPTVGIIQLDIQLGDKQANLNHALIMASHALEKQPVDLFCLPELFSTGYCPKACLHKNAEEIPNGETCTILRKFAQDHSVSIAGSIVEAGSPPFNSLVVIDPQGQLIANYRKLHLFKLMNEHHLVQPGNTIVTTNIPNIGPVGLMTCYDIRFPELARKLVTAQHAQTLLIVSEFPYPRQDHWQILLQARAIENQCYVIACNRVGKDISNTYFGLSMVISPWGKILNELSSEEKVIVVQYDNKEIMEARNKLTCLQDRRSDIY